MKCHEGGGRRTGTPTTPTPQPPLRKKMSCMSKGTVLSLYVTFFPLNAECVRFKEYSITTPHAQQPDGVKLLLASSPCWLTKTSDYYFSNGRNLD